MVVAEQDARSKKKLKFSDIPTEYTLPQVYHRHNSSNNRGGGGGAKTGKEGKLRQSATVNAPGSHGKHEAPGGERKQDDSDGGRAEWNGRFHAQDEGSQSMPSKPSKEGGRKAEIDEYRANYRIIGECVVLMAYLSGTV